MVKTSIGMESAGNNLQSGLLWLNPAFPSAYVFFPLHLQIFRTPIVFKVKDLNFEATGTNTHADSFAIDYWVLELEFMFAVGNACKDDSTHEKTSCSSSGVFHRWQVFL